MDKNNHTINHPPFLARYWWGIFCSILFFIGGAHQCSTRTMPSTMFEGPTYFGKAEKGAVLLIQKTADNFKILVSEGENFYYSKGSDKKLSESPYPFTEVKDRVQIVGMTPQLSQREMNALWAGDPVRTSENQDGTIKVSIGYDAPGQALSGVYFVSGNVIFGHHFKQGSLLKGLFFMCSVIVLYASGAAVKGIFRNMARLR